MKLEIYNPKTYSIFYTTPETINIFLPFYYLYSEEINEFIYHKNEVEKKFGNIKLENYNPYYTVIKMTFDYPLPYELIDIVYKGNNVIFSFPLEYSLRNTIYFYSSDEILAKFNYQLILNNRILDYAIFFNSYQMEIPLDTFFKYFETEFISYEKKEELNFKKDKFWFAVNGTYFAKTNNRYFTVAGVVKNDNVISYPVEHRPPRGFWAILQQNDQKSLLFDKLPNLKKDFIEFIRKINLEYKIVFLLQAGPLIYKNSQFVMDADSEGLGEKGNNILNPAPRTILYTDKDGNIKVEVIYGIEGKKKKDLIFMNWLLIYMKLKMLLTLMEVALQ